MEEEKAVFHQNNIEFTLYQCHTERELVDNLREYAVVAIQYAPMTRNVLENLPNLRCIVRYGVGVDTIDLSAAAELGIAVCNVPDYGVQEVASHAFAWMMTLCRKLIPAGEDVRQGIWQYENYIPIQRFSTMTVGVVGIGRIGRCFAGMLRPLGCRVLACDPAYAAHQAPEGVTMTDLDTLLRQSDVVSLHVPLEMARNLIDTGELKKMKPTAYLINVSRGGIVNEGALAQALEEGWIAGAAFDVLVQEPPAREHPLVGLKNFYCTPHMAWYSEQASRDMKTKLAEEMVRAVKGEPLRNRISCSGIQLGCR